MRSCIWVLLAAVTGCVPITTTTTYSDTLVSRRTSVDPIPGSLRFSATPHLTSQALAVTLTRAESCRSTVTPIYRRTAHVSHEATGTWTPGYTVALGVLGVASGTLLYARADYFADQDSQDGRDTSPSDYRAAGVAAAAVGLVALAVAGIDVARLRDFDEDLGRRRGTPETQEAACNERPVARTRLTVRAIATDWSTESTTDAAGAAQISLHDLPEGPLQGGELSLIVEINGASVPVAVAAPDAASLLAELAADPTSRVAIDRDGRKTAACDEQLAAAASALDPAIANTERELDVMAERWQSARQACDDKWGAQHEHDFQVFAAQVETRKHELARAAEAQEREMAAAEAAEKRALAAAARERQREEQRRRAESAPRAMAGFPGSTVELPARGFRLADVLGKSKREADRALGHGRQMEDGPWLYDGFGRVAVHVVFERGAVVFVSVVAPEFHNTDADRAAVLGWMHASDDVDFDRTHDFDFELGVWAPGAQTRQLARRNLARQVTGALRSSGLRGTAAANYTRLELSLINEADCTRGLLSQLAQEHGLKSAGFDSMECIGMSNDLPKLQL